MEWHCARMRTSHRRPPDPSSARCRWHTQRAQARREATAWGCWSGRGDRKAGAGRWRRCHPQPPRLYPRADASATQRGPLRTAVAETHGATELRGGAWAQRGSVDGLGRVGERLAHLRPGAQTAPSLRPSPRLSLSQTGAGAPSTLGSGWVWQARRPMTEKSLCR